VAAEADTAAAGDGAIVERVVDRIEAAIGARPNGETSNSLFDILGAWDCYLKQFGLI
jgi:hypothetical protein